MAAPISHMAVLMAAYVRMIAEYPAVNRFIVNKRAYSRNEIAIGMVVLQGGHTDKANDGTMSKIYFQPTDTIFDAEEKIQHYVSENREAAADNATEQLIAKLVAIPGLLRFAVNFLKWADKHNLLTKGIIDASPFHTSMVFTNLASIRTNHIYHHCYDFGHHQRGGWRPATPVRCPPPDAARLLLKSAWPLGVVMDELHCSGSYFAMAFRA